MRLRPSCQQLATDGEEYRRRVDDLGRTVEEIQRRKRIVEDDS
jgi:hypothetical protein